MSLGDLYFIPIVGGCDSGITSGKMTENDQEIQFDILSIQVLINDLKTASNKHSKPSYIECHMLQINRQ